MLVFLARRVPLRLQRQSRSLRPLCRDVRATYSISMGSIWTGVPSYCGVGNINIDGVVMLLNGCKKTDGRRQSVRRGPPKRAKAGPRLSWEDVVGWWGLRHAQAEYWMQGSNSCAVQRLGAGEATRGPFLDGNTMKASAVQQTRQTPDLRARC